MERAAGSINRLTSSARVGEVTTGEGKASIFQMPKSKGRGSPTLWAGMPGALNYNGLFDRNRFRSAPSGTSALRRS